MLGGVKLGGSLIFPSKENLYDLIFGKGKGVEIRLHPDGSRYTKSWFKTEKEAKKAEARKREEIENPTLPMAAEATQTDMGFLELVNKRLDYLKDYCSERHYTDHIYYAKRWCGV